MYRANVESVNKSLVKNEGIGYPVKNMLYFGRKRSKLQSVGIRNEADTDNDCNGINFMPIGSTECDKNVSIISRGVVDIRMTAGKLKTMSWCWILQDLSSDPNDPLVRCFVDFYSLKTESVRLNTTARVGTNDDINEFIKNFNGTFCGNILTI